MNKAIKELVIQAAESTKWKPGLGNEDVAAYMQKFAEMIIKECAEVTEYYYTRNECVSPKQIQQHFGIEE